MESEPIKLFVLNEQGKDIGVRQGYRIGGLIVFKDNPTGQLCYCKEITHKEYQLRNVGA